MINVTPTPIKFDVVDRTNLPFELDGGNTRYAQVLGAALRLNGSQVICIPGTSQRELSSIYNGINYMLKKDARFEGIRVAQRDSKIFVFRSK